MYRSVKDKEIDEIKKEVKKNLRNKIREEIILEMNEKIEKNLNDKLVEYYNVTAKLMAEISVMSITGLERYDNIVHLREIDTDFKKISEMYRDLLTKLEKEKKIQKQIEKDRKLEEQKAFDERMKLMKHNKRKGLL